MDKHLPKVYSLDEFQRMNHKIIRKCNIGRLFTDPLPKLVAAINFFFSFPYHGRIEVSSTNTIVIVPSYIPETCNIPP